MGRDGYGLGAMGLGDFSHRAIFVFFMLDRRADEGGEKRMRFERLGFEFGVELAAEEPWMVGRFDDLDVIFVGSAAGDAEAGAGQNFFVVTIEFVAMAVTLADFGFAVGASRRMSRVRVCRAMRRGAWCRPFRPRRGVRAVYR